MNKNDYRSLVSFAYKILQKGRTNGTILPQPCAICHTEKTEGHHTDYKKPFEVVWLCQTHHRNAHKGVLQFLGPETIYRTIDCHGNKVSR